jgi:hypothetical protein
MSSENLHTPESAAPAEADDFKLIKGIGQGIENRLHTAGILTFAQLAALSPADIATFVADIIGMTVERINKQNWIGQARELASGPDPTGQSNNIATHQHYATFIVELLLDATNDVRRTRVVHAQTTAEEAWAGWEEARVMNFFVQHAELPQMIAPPKPTLGGTFEVRELTISPARPDMQCSILPCNQPFDVRLLLDLTKVIVPDHLSLDYAAVIYAKELGGGARRVAAKVRDTITPDCEVTIDVMGAAVPEGTYRLQAEVTLALHMDEPTDPGIAASLLAGCLLHTY